MAYHKVDVEPDILVWARESIGLTRAAAAHELKMTELSLRYLEEGVGDVSMPRLRDMAKVYDRPLIAFLLTEPSRDDDTLPDFRAAPQNQDRPWSPELHREFRRVAGQREIILDIVSGYELDAIPTIDLNLDTSIRPEVSAAQICHWLLGDQNASLTKIKLRGLSSLIEGRGLLVVQTSGIKVSEMRGFSIGLHPLPAIAVNGADSQTARRFTLLHELVHVLLRRSALCDLRGMAVDPLAESRDVERYCNLVAAAALMPSAEVLQHQSVAKATSETQWDFQGLRPVARDFNVSVEAMLLRLMALQRARKSNYSVLKPVFDSLGSDRSGGMLTYYKGKIRNLGRRYISTVLAAHDRGEITDTALSRYLDIKLKNVPKLIQTLGPAE